MILCYIILYNMILCYIILYHIGQKVNSFRTTPTPNPEKLYKYYPVTKQEETCF